MVKCYKCIRVWACWARSTNLWQHDTFRYFCMISVSRCFSAIRLCAKMQPIVHYDCYRLLFRLYVFSLVCCETIGSPRANFFYPRPMSMMPSVRENCACCSQNPKFICTFDTENFFLLFFISILRPILSFFSLFATFNAHTGKRKAKQYTKTEWMRKNRKLLLFDGSFSH